MNSEQKKTTIAIIIWTLVVLLAGLSYLEGGRGSVDGIIDKKPVYRVDPELEQHLTSFVALAKLKGIDLSYIYEKDITIRFTDAENQNHVATSFGCNKDKIIIMVHRKRFYSRTEEGQKYVMYHEFGHDILDFKHLEGGHRGMMEPTAYTGFFKNYKRFSKGKQETYLYQSLNKMFDRYLGEGDHITDEAKEWIMQSITKLELDGEIWVTVVWYMFDEDFNIIAIKTITHPEGEKVDC